MKGEVGDREHDTTVARHTARPQREGAKMRQRPKTTLPPHNSITVTVTRSFMVEGANPHQKHPAKRGSGIRRAERVVDVRRSVRRDVVYGTSDDSV